MSRLLVVRHAQSVWNAQGRWQGWSDAPLSEVGTEQARRAGQALAAAGTQPDMVACSDLSRARRTAELIAGELGYHEALVVDPDLREQDLGEWNGRTSAEIAVRWPSELEARRQGRLGTVPGGERGDHFAERAVGALGRLAQRGAREAIVVTHGGVVIALEQALGTWAPGNHHTNLSGWWTESGGAPPDLELVPVTRVDLSAPRSETVTGPA